MIKNNNCNYKIKVGMVVDNHWNGTVEWNGGIVEWWNGISLCISPLK